MTGFEAALSEIEDRKWVNDQDAQALERWLHLFACSDEPRRLFEAIEKLPESVRIPGWRMREALNL
ncbi:TPA: hypothetical protein L3M79_003851, partial [Clostridioides difficile]|nr:hypothetical protein [Clostridioides difficile]